jgi:predicted extracellular nuclease
VSRSSHLAAAGVASALIAAGVVALPAGSASAVSPDVVISEVYGGGGNSGATYTHDFVELHNAGTSSIDLTGWSVQYASRTGTSWQVTPLSGSIEPGQRFLVQQARGNGGTEPLPTPDVEGRIAMGGSDGKVALVRSTTRLPSSCKPQCPTYPGVADFVGYGDADEFEGEYPAPALSSTTSATRRGADTDENYFDFRALAPNPVSTTGGAEAPAPERLEDATVAQVQGAAHLSPHQGKVAADVDAVVTAVKADGFWMQSLEPDDDPATSEGALVYTRRSPGVAQGDLVRVTGEIEEYRPGGSGGWDNLTTTELTYPEITVLGQGELPAPTMIGEDRVPPSDVIDDDSTSSVEWSGTFDAATDGIDFWESMEGMVLGIDDARATGPTNGFGELSVVARGAEPNTPRGGLYVTADDFNPERVILDDDLASTPVAHTGDTLAGTTVGVLDYSFANFKLLPWETPEVVSGGITRESTTRALGSDLAIASYNVENLDAGDPQEKFDALAQQIVHNLKSPDVIGLEEVQDDSGPADDGTTSPARTLDMLTQAIQRAGGPAYDWRQIDPVDGEEGGQPGGNIRVVFLFNTDRGVEFVDRGTPTSSTPATFFTDEEGVTHLETSPARVAPDSPAWDDSRVPLVGEFTWKGRTFFAVANHFGSKGGDDPLFGRWQPPYRSSEVQRHQQAREVRELVDDLLAVDPDARVAVLGDINDFEFSETTDILVGSGDTALTDLPRTLPANERYTYVYQGNSQVLDHILLSPRFVADTYSYDIVHVNAEFADQISDHDPQVVRLGNPNRVRP